MMSRPWTVKFLAAAMSLAAALCLATSASAVFIVNDTWQDGTDSDPAAPIYSENGIDDDSDGDLESVWFKGGGGTLDPAGAGGPLQMVMDGGAAGTSSSSWSTYFTPEGDEVELRAAGEKITVTWNFTTGDVNATNTSQNFRIALVDSPPAARIIADGTPGNSAYRGYGIFANMGETFGHANPFELNERVVPIVSSALLSAGGSWEDDFLASFGGTDGNSGFTDNTQYSFVMELERNALDQIEITSTITGGTLDDGAGFVTASATDTDPTSFKFDLFGVRPSGGSTTASSFATTLFRVDAPRIVPEPASLILLGLAGLALTMLARRRD